MGEFLEIGKSKFVQNPNPHWKLEIGNWKIDGFEKVGEETDLTIHHQHATRSTTSILKRWADVRPSDPLGSPYYFLTYFCAKKVAPNTLFLGV